METTTRTPKFVYGDRKIRYYKHVHRFSAQHHVIVIEGADEWEGPEVARFEDVATARRFWLANVREWLRQGKEFKGVEGIAKGHVV